MSKKGVLELKMDENRMIMNYIENEELNIEKIMEEFTPYIYKIVLNKNLKVNEEDIEEIVSDVFLAIWKNKDNLDTSKSISSYLAGITHNLCAKKLRNNNENINVEEYKNIYEDKTISNIVENTEKNNIIISELGNMKKEDKDIFMLYYYHSKSIGNIANILNISESKVKSRLFRIRRKLKKSLERKGYSYDG